MKTPRRHARRVPETWPRNIVPYDDRKLRALSTPGHVALFEATPLCEIDLTATQRALADEMVDAGLLRRQGTRYVAIQRHRRDAPPGTPGREAHKRAVLACARDVVEDTGATLDAQGADATCAIGMIPIPDTPEAMARAFGILAEAEDQLRALREELPRARGAAEFRVLLFVGSQAPR